MDKSAKIYIAGHTGLVGSAVTKKLHTDGYSNLVLRTRSELDLMNQEAVDVFFNQEKPDYVIDCAAKVGGVGVNLSHPAEFLYENLQIQNNIIWSAKASGVKKLLFIGSSTVYGRECPQPIREEYLLMGPPEKSNEAYAYSKIAGLKLCEYINAQFNMNFISCLPTNIYGEKSDFNPETANVIPSLIHRMHDAKMNHLPEVIIWGTGISRREFLYVDDLADAIMWLMNHYNNKQFLNIGTGEDISIKELAENIKLLVGYTGKLTFDSTKPDGSPRRQLDVSKIHATGWHHKTRLAEGLKRTYEHYLANIAK